MWVALIAGWTGAWISLWGALLGAFVGLLIAVGAMTNPSVSHALFHLGIGQPVTALSVASGIVLGAVGGFLVVLRTLFVSQSSATGLSLLSGAVLVAVVVVILIAAYERLGLRLRGYRRLSRDEVRRIAPLVKAVADAFDLPALPRSAMADTIVLVAGLRRLSSCPGLDAHKGAGRRAVHMRPPRRCTTQRRPLSAAVPRHAVRFSFKRNLRDRCPKLEAVDRQRSAIELVERVPFLDELRLQATKADVLDEDSEDVPNTGGRGRVDTVRSKGMRGDAQILACGPVGTAELVRAEADLGTDVYVGEVEDSLELDLVAVKDPREQPLHHDRLTFAESLQLRDRARAALADVEHGKASRRVEPPAVKTRPLAAQRVVAGSEVPKAVTGERREWRGDQAAGVDDHPLMP